MTDRQMDGHAAYACVTLNIGEHDKNHFIGHVPCLTGLANELLLYSDD